MSNVVDEDRALALVKGLSRGELETFAANVARIALEGDFGADSQQDLVTLMKHVGLRPDEFVQNAEDVEYDAQFDFSMPTRMQVIVYGKVSAAGAFRVRGWCLDTGDYHQPDDAYVLTEIARQLADEPGFSVSSTNSDAPSYITVVYWKDGGRIEPLDTDGTDA